MRFAGTRIEGLLGDRPDYGAAVSNASTLRSQEDQAITDAMGKTAAAGIDAAGVAKSAKITGSAESALARAKGQASMMSTLGQIGGSAIGAYGDYKFGGSPIKTSSDNTPGTFASSSVGSWLRPNV